MKWSSRTKPMPHQKECYHAVTEFGGVCLIGDEMGLGKTFESLLWVVQNECYPCIILCKATLKYNWQKEIKEHFGQSSIVLEGRKVNPRVLRRSNFIILNFDILDAWSDTLMEIDPETLILDECQGVANRKTIRYKRTFNLRWCCDYFLALSGTPVRNRPIEFWTVLNMLRPKKFPSYVQFGVKYCKPSIERGKLVFRGAENLDKLNRRLRCCMIRRLKKDVLTSLPEKTREVIPLPYDNKYDYKKAEKNFLQWVAETHGKGAMIRAKKSESLMRTGYLRRLIIANKIRSVIDWVKTFLEESNEKLVLFCCHTEPIDRLVKAFPKIHVRVDGGVSNRHRALAVERFQKSHECKLFIGNIDAAGEGLTLTAASHLAFVEMDWVPTKHEQAEARIHRISQDFRCFIYYLIAEGTIEERIAKQLTTKSANINQMIDAGANDEMEILSLLAKPV